jgi:hypothetical protein
MGPDRQFDPPDPRGTALNEEHLRELHEIGLASVEAGRVGPLDIEAIKTLGRQLLARQIQVGIDDIAAGRVAELDVDAIKRRGREALRERRNES